MTTLRLLLSALIVSVLMPVVAHAEFEWGGDCESGQGEFTQDLGFRSVEEVGTIPAGKRNVRIDLSSAVDADVQVIHADGTAIIRWPDGLLNEWYADSVTYDGVTYRWSGWAGDGTNYGNEYIEVYGDTTAELTMLAFGYEAGSAQVEYSFEAIPTCGEKGEGSFSQVIPFRDRIRVGEIDRNVVNLRIDLDSPVDTDIELWAGDVAIVAWLHGMLSGSGEQSVEYEGMTISWSGYNGDGINYGREYIEVWGRVTTPLTMYAYGYERGRAVVDYEFGIGAGATCGGIATLSCEPGLFCKNWQTGVSDPAGSCHGELWCHPDSATADCRNVVHPAVPGQWGCNEFQCAWETTIPGGGSCALTSLGVTTVGFEALLNAPNNYIGQRVRTTWTVDAPLTACTKMFCGDAACCNTCSARLRLQNVGDGDTAESIELDGLGCAGMDCDWQDFCDQPIGSVVTVEGTLTETLGRLHLDVENHCGGAEVACSMMNTSCPTGLTCEWGCPTAENCGINPPGVCVTD